MHGDRYIYRCEGYHPPDVPWRQGAKKQAPSERCEKLHTLLCIHNSITFLNLKLKYFTDLGVNSWQGSSRQTGSWNFGYNTTG